MQPNSEERLRLLLHRRIRRILSIPNSGDTLAAPEVTERMVAALEKTLDIKHHTSVDILYGDMLKIGIKQNVVDKCSRNEDITLSMFYRGCLNHSPAYIKRSLFEDYGLYDETLKICSDWKFYELAEVAVFLLSDASKFISGEIIPCNQENHYK